MSVSPNLARFLLFCLLFISGFISQAQSIDTPKVYNTPVCAGSNMDISFVVHNGLLTYFTTGTTYYVYLENVMQGENSRILLKSFQSNTAPPWIAYNSATITEAIPIPEGITGRSDYYIFISSTSPSFIWSGNSSAFTIKDKPASPAISSNGPICIGNALQLTASTISGASYNWTGPGGFTSTAQNPTRTNFTAEMAGEYTVTATVNGCTSDPVSTTVGTDFSNNKIAYGETGTVCVTRTETYPGVTSVTITAPLGTVFTSVDFASWGTPHGSCGSFHINTTCHASSSRSIVENYLLGKNSATIPLSNNIFGDPCTTTTKRLYVQATYAESVEPLCNGSDPGTITGTTPEGGGNLGYLWESSTTGPASGFSPAIGTNNLQNYNPGELTQTTWFKRTVFNTCSELSSNIIEIQVRDIPSAPTVSNNGPICFGGNLNLTASSIAGATYSWTGPNGFSSTAQNPTLPNATAAMAGTYSVIATVNGCPSVPGTTTVVGNVPTGSQTTTGVDNWVGHVYDGTGFNTYVGSYTETETFDQVFGGADHCFPLNSNSIFTETFSVRYKMNSTRNGLYVVNLGSDDGSRLKVDGSLVYDNWDLQTYVERPRVLFSLSGESNLEYEYYEQGTDNRVNFNNLVRVIENNLTVNNIQNICPGDAAITISGDSFMSSLPSGISGAGYQWTYSTSPGEAGIEIPGATSATFTPNINTAPFNNPGTYYLYRNASLSSTNNTGVSGLFTPYVATHESNPAILVINPEISNNQINYGTTGTICKTANENGSITMTAPAGTVFTSVDFASYGTPNGSCENFTLGACHASTSQAVVEGYLLGKNSATIPATNAIFGDPCVTTVKRLFIQATYAESKEPLCSGSTPGIITGSTPSGGTGFTYLWQSSTTGPASGFSPVAGTNNTKDYSPGELTETTWFRRSLISNCTTIFSNSVEIKVYLPISNNIIDLPVGVQEICTGESPGTITGALATGGNGALTYLWERSTVGPNTGFSAASGVNNTQNYTPGILHQTTWFRRSAISANCGTNKSNVVEVPVNPLPTVVLSGTNTICIGQSTPITGTFTGTGPWTVTLNIDNTVHSIPVNASPYTFPVNPTSTTTYSITSISDANCTTSVNTSVTITVLENNEWTGNTSTDWNTSSNWSCGAVPTLNTTVIIPGGLTNYPVLNTGSQGLSKNIEIQTGATLDVLDNTLQISGTIDNQGEFDALDGTIAMVGSTVQNIPAETFFNNRIKNLLVNNTAGVNLVGDLEISGLVKAVNGNLSSNNFLKLISNNVQTALIDGSGNGNITGTVHMQRYLSNSFGYKYFSSPFQNSSVRDFSAYIDLNASFPNFYNYNENRQDAAGNDATGWEAYTTATSNLNLIEGYALNFGNATGEETVEIAGTVNNGGYSRTLYNHNGLYTQGFNLVGNPYPSPIDWNAATGWTKTNIDNAIYFFTAGSTNRYTGTYTSYVNGIQSSDGKSSNIIPSMQGFFVHVSDITTDDSPTMGTLGMTNEVRVNNFTQKFLKQQKRKVYPLIRLTAGFTKATHDDPAVIYFNGGSSLEFEKELDAHKLMNTDVEVPNFYSLTPKGKKLAINAIPNPEMNDIDRIPLGINVQKNGTVFIRLKDLQNISPASYIYLVDQEKNITQDLNSNPEYHFQARKGQYDTRFYLLFSSTKITNAAIIFDEPFSVETGNNRVLVRMNLKTGQKGHLRISTVSGQILNVLPVMGKETTEIKAIRSSGVYFINLLSDGETFSRKILVKE